jgi:Tfp pilus assembly protein PilO
MAKVQQWAVLTALGVLAVLAAGWFLLVSPQRADAAALRLQAEQQQSANAALRTGLAVLSEQAKKLPQQRAALTAVAAKIPDNPALPPLIRALTVAGERADVEFISVVPGPPVAVSPTGATTLPAAGASPLMSIPVTVNVAGGYYEIEQYLAALESLPRTFRVTTVAITPGVGPTGGAQVDLNDGRHLTAAITGQVYTTGSAAPATGPATGTGTGTARTTGTGAASTAPAQ